MTDILFPAALRAKLAEIAAAIPDVDVEFEEIRPLHGVYDLLTIDAKDERRYVMIQPAQNPDDGSVDPDTIYVEYFTRDDNHEAEYITGEPVSMDGLPEALRSWFAGEHDPK